MPSESTEFQIKEYLQAAGIVGISIICFRDHYAFRRGMAPPADAISTDWIEEKLARAVMRHARTIAGKQPDRETAQQALQRAAAAYRAGLTPSNIVMSRALFAARKLRAFMELAQQNGQLAAFNAAYRRQRISASMRGEGFMTYGTAVTRLRRGIIEMLIAKRPLPEAAVLFDEALGNSIPRRSQAS